MSNNEEDPTRTKERNRRTETVREAFTLIELVFLIGAIAVLLAVAGRGLARTRPITQGSQCMANSRTLMMASMMYAFDNRDALPMNFHGGFVPSPTGTSKPWIAGWLDWTTSSDNTNTIYLGDPRYAPLAPYFGRDSSVFHCPADAYASLGQQTRGWTHRARSISANIYVGKGNGWASGTDYTAGGPNNLTIYRGAAKTSDLIIPEPARTWVYIDEHPDSLNDGAFFPPDSATTMPDAPATYHNGAAGVAMADGHSELHRWRGPALNKPRASNGRLGVAYQTFNNYVTVRGDPDLSWLSFGSPRRTSRTTAD